MYAILVQLCTEVHPVTVADTDVCVDFMRTVSGSVRDALHVAVIRNNGVEAVATYGMGFGVYGVGPWPMEQSHPPTVRPQRSGHGGQRSPLTFAAVQVREDAPRRGTRRTRTPCAAPSQAVLASDCTAACRSVPVPRIEVWDCANPTLTNSTAASSTY